MAHGHSHGGEASWRPARKVRLILLGCLAPFVLVTVAGLVILWPSHHRIAVPLQYTTYGAGKTVFEKGRVTAVTSRTCGGTAGTGKVTVCTTAKVAVTSGPDRGKTVSLTTGGVGGVNLRVGDHIRVLRGPVINPQTGERAYSFDDYVRDVPLLALALVFAVLLVAVARWRGVAALAGLVGAFGVLAYFLLPALVEGKSPIATALVGCSAILLIALYVAHGFSSRTTTALLGTLCALLATAGFAAVATASTRLTGRSNEVNAEVQAAGIPVSISGILLAGLIIGTLGVINDVTVTQASSVWELSAADPTARWRTLFTSGMRIGRDHIASVVYTLVFAYTGAALPTLLLFSISGRSFHDLLTSDEIASEIVRDLVGGAGLVLAVPFTTLIAALVAARPHEAEPDTGARTADARADDAQASFEERIATSTLHREPRQHPPEGQ